MDIHKQSLENIEAFFRESKNQVSSWMAAKRLVAEMDELRAVNERLHDKIAEREAYIEGIKATCLTLHRGIDTLQATVAEINAENTRLKEVSGEDTAVLREFIVSGAYEHFRDYDLDCPTAHNE